MVTILIFVQIKFFPRRHNRSIIDSHDDATITYKIEIF